MFTWTNVLPRFQWGSAISETKASCFIGSPYLHSKTIKAPGHRPPAFIWFLVFGTLMKLTVNSFLLFVFIVKHHWSIFLLSSLLRFLSHSSRYVLKLHLKQNQGEGKQSTWVLTTVFQVKTANPYSTHAIIQFGMLTNTTCRKFKMVNAVIILTRF